MIPKVVSLFSGCGGFDVGLEMAGAKTIYACDIFKDGLLTLSENIKDVDIELKDIKKIKYFPNAEVIIGGYPCQGFSVAGKRLVTDPRNFLYKEYVRAIQQVKPYFFIAENVKGLLTMSNGEVIEAMVNEFAEQGYVVKYKLVNSKDYGVPQDRQRVFIVGVRNDINFEYEFPDSTHGIDKIPYVTLRDSISHLPEWPEGDFDDSGFSSRYMSRNRKRSWDDVSFTIQASGRHAPMHPMGEPMLKVDKDKWIFQGDYNRKLSYLECAYIQGFPEGFRFYGNLRNKYKMIGNAVPPLLAKKIAEPIINFLS